MAEVGPRPNLSENNSFGKAREGSTEGSQDRAHCVFQRELISFGDGTL